MSGNHGQVSDWKWLRLVGAVKLLALLLSALTFVNVVQAQININFVTVGNPGNVPDPATGCGEVDYIYAIGTYDVTLNQYCAFLNAVAATSDPYALYNSNLETDGNIEGIQQSGSLGNYTYTVIGNSGNDPVTYVNWFDAARFCNWLSNGQPRGGEGNGTTETGAYTLSGTMSGGLSINKNTNAQYWIPTENEWYKAAYYDPNYGGAGVGGYWLYSTKSNTVPGNSWANRTSPNQANYFNDSYLYCVTQSNSYSPTQNYLTPVGSFTNSASAYGTFDQGGDVWQWNDSVWASFSRGLRGGTWATNKISSTSSPPFFDDPPLLDSWVGFRVATAPSPLALWLLSNGLAYNANLQSSPNNDGVPLLMDYAFNLNPTKNQSKSIPQPVVSGRQMSLTYYAGSPGVTYTPQASTDLQNWSTAGMTVTGPDANNNCMATIPLSGSNGFMRLQVTY